MKRIRRISSFMTRGCDSRRLSLSRPSQQDIDDFFLEQEVRIKNNLSASQERIRAARSEGWDDGLSDPTRGAGRVPYELMEHRR